MQLTRRRATALRAVLLCTTLTPSMAFADDEPKGIYLEAPLTDGAIASRDASPLPTMQQSLWLSTDLYESVHFGLGKVLDPYDTKWWRGSLGRVMTGAADFLLVSLPLGAAWQHEEWHRAVLKTRGVESYNGVYDLDPFRDVIPVKHVADEGLARFKAEHPAEFVRMGTAGIEANYELATNIEKVHVFYNPRTWPSVSVGILNLINIVYMATCASPESDASLVRDEANETLVRERDFTGYDCTGWVYDLHRPTEPYAARGAHPSGVGVRRYRRWADLTPDERDYLETQRTLSFLNLLDPVMFGFPAFRVAKGTRATAHVRHMPTSFGSAINLEVFFAGGLTTHRPLNLFASIQSYFNRDHYFPGLALELQRLPLTNVLDRQSWVSARVALWLQPLDQSFTTATIQPGGVLATRFGYEATSSLSPFLEIEGKSAGWLAGNVALGPALAFRAGLTLWAR